MTRWATPRLPDLVGSKEAAEILGVHKATLNRWLKPESGPHGSTKTYMIEPKYIDAGPVWVRADVERFAAEQGRQRAAATEPRADEAPAAA